MAPSTEQILQSVLALPEEERLELTEALLDISSPPADWADEEWKVVVRRRSAEIESGAVQPRNWEQVRIEARRRIGLAD